jgi:undecaprenyl-diphosphatase
MDTSVYHALNNFAYEHAWVGDIAKFFAQYAVFLLVGAVALAWLARWHGEWLAQGRTRLALFGAGLATLLALLIVQVINQLWDRQRPFVVLHEFHKLIAHPADASFPSDHVSGSFGIVVALMLFRRWRAAWAALTVAVLIGVARVMVGIHWPTDILGGVGVGALAALLVAGPQSRRALAWLCNLCTALYARVLLAPLGLLRGDDGAAGEEPRPATGTSEAPGVEAVPRARTPVQGG